MSGSAGEESGVGLVEENNAKGEPTICFWYSVVDKERETALMSTA